MQYAQHEARNEKQRSEAQQALKSAAAASAVKQEAIQERVKKELAEEVIQKVPLLIPRPARWLQDYSPEQSSFISVSRRKSKSSKESKPE